MSATPRNPQNGVKHVDEVTGLLYIEGQLEQDAARDVVAHLGECSACRQLLDVLKRESLLLRQALIEDDEPIPARLLAMPRPEGLSWGWLAILGLASLGMYSLWDLYVSPSLDSLQQSGFGGQFVFTWLLLNGAFWKGWNDMLQFLIYGSLAVLAFVLLFLFRRNVRRPATFSIFLGLLVPLALMNPPAAHASQFIKQRQTYEITRDQTVKDDVFIMGTTVRIDGTLEGDIVCMCHNLSVEGHVTGDVIAFATSVRIDGKVDGNVRTFTEHESINGQVGHNVMGFIADFESAPQSNVAGSVTLFVGHMIVEGPIGRALNAYFGDGTINTAIGGDALLRAGRGDHAPLIVAQKADIAGGLRYKGPRQPQISPQARIAGTPDIEIIPERPWYFSSTSYWFNVMIWGSGLLVGLFFISVAPEFVREASREVVNIGPPLAAGIVLFIVMPIAAILACVTVVGLGLGIPLLFMDMFLIFFAQVITAIAVGEAILGNTPDTWPLTGRLALGLLVVRALALVPVIGLFVRMVACVLGIGAIGLVIYRQVQKRPLSPQAPAPLPASAS